MLKTVYLSILLSILLLNSETTFGQTIKKEIGICGKTLGAILETDPTSGPVLDSLFMNNDEFCDNGRYEENANFIIYIYNSKNELVYDKHVFLNEHTFIEEADPKGVFKKIKVLPSSNSRIIKIPITKEMGEVVSYKIKSLINNKTYDNKKIKW